MSGFPTLLYKEVLRFWKVAFQTVAGPVLGALLFVVIFAQVLGERVRVYEDVPYAAFLVPGLVMMSVLQNAFANSSSSLIQSKVTGNLVFVLLAPISHAEFFAAYVLASMARGLVVGAGVLAVTAAFVELRLDAPLWALAFALLGSRQHRLQRWFRGALPFLFLYNLISFTLPIALGTSKLGYGQAIANSMFWLMWFLILALIAKFSGGPEHPPYEPSELSKGRRIIAWICLAMFVLLFMPSWLRAG